MSTIGAINLAMSADHGKLSKDLKIAVTSVEGFEKKTKSSGQSFIATWSHMTNAITGTIAVLKGIGNIVAGPLQLAAAAEQTKVALTTLLGSGEAAGKMLADLNKFAAETPFEFPELSDAAKKMVAFGFDAEAVIPNLRKLGDVASGLNVPLSELTNLLGKNKIKDKIQAEQMNQWLERGIPVTKELAKQFGVAETAVGDLVSSGKVRFEHMMKALTDLTAEGGQFGGMMKAQSQTLGGLWSTLSDNIGLALTDLGTSISDAFNLKGAMASTISFLESMKPAFQSFVAGIKAWVDFLKPVFVQLGNVIIARFTSMYEFWKEIFSGMATTVGSFLPSLTDMRDMVLFGLIAMEFGFTNWKDVAGAAINWVALKFVTFGLDTMHLFTVQLPELFKWFSENTIDVLIEFAAFTATIMYNLGANLIRFFTSIPDLISGAMDFGDVWKPLTDGFEVTLLKEFPKIIPRAKSEIEKNLEGAIGGVGKDFEAFRQKRMKELFPDEQKKKDVEVAKKGIGALPKVPEPTEKKSPFAGALQLGTNEAREAIFRNRFGGTAKGPNAKLENLAKQQLEETKKQTKAVEKAQKTTTVSIG